MVVMACSPAYLADDGEWGPMADARLCCDGNGGFVTCWRPGFVRDPDNPLYVCLARHEREHVTHFRKRHPEACKGKPRGHATFAMTFAERDAAECEAYAIQVSCLRGYEWAVGDAWRELKEYAEAIYGCRSR